jgi:hypothetical protein
MKRGWKLINRSSEIFELEKAGVCRETSLRGEFSPLCCREGWEFDSNPLKTFVVDVAFVDEIAYDQDQLFLVDFEELLKPVIVVDTGSLNGGFDINVNIIRSFEGDPSRHRAKLVRRAARVHRSGSVMESIGEAHRTRVYEPPVNESWEEGLYSWLCEHLGCHGMTPNFGHFFGFGPKSFARFARCGTQSQLAHSQHPTRRVS